MGGTGAQSVTLGVLGSNWSLWGYWGPVGHFGGTGVQDWVHNIDRKEFTQTSRLSHSAGLSLCTTHAHSCQSDLSSSESLYCTGATPHPQLISESHGQDSLKCHLPSTEPLTIVKDRLWSGMATSVSGVGRGWRPSRCRLAFVPLWGLGLALLVYCAWE